MTENNVSDRTLPPDITLQEDTDYSIVAAKNSSEHEIPTNDTIQCSKIICPPPWLTPNVVFSPECVCSQFASYLQQNASKGADNGEGKIPVIFLK